MGNGEWSEEWRVGSKWRVKNGEGVVDWGRVEWESRRVKSRQWRVGIGEWRVGSWELGWEVVIGIVLG